MNSFRLRLALLVGATTAVLLFAVGFFAWKLTTRFNLERLDRELRNIAKPNLQRIGDASNWERVEEALRFVAGPDRAPPYVLWVKNYDRMAYRSARWPADIDPEKYPAPTTYEGGLTFTTPPPPPRRVGISPSNPALPSKEPYFLTVSGKNGTWRLGVMGNPYTTLLLAANLEDYNADLDRLRVRFLTALPVVLLVLVGGAWFLAARALQPVTLLTQAAERINERGLDQRISAPAHDREFKRLVTVFNAMMDRLEQAFHQARRFSADASHELKTPLALLQAELEQALHSAPSGSSQQQTYTSLLDEIHRLKAILEKLLLLSLADSGRLSLQRAPTDLTEMVGNVIEDCAALAPGLGLEHVIAPSVTVDADAVLLEQALQNMLNNAVKYNRADGLIRVVLKVEAGSAMISVGNTGAGIAPADQARLFERFFRGDPSRTRERGSGVGLGLSLSREILRAHAGELTLGRSETDWTEFIAVIPLTVPAKV